MYLCFPEGSTYDTKYLLASVRLAPLYTCRTNVGMGVTATVEVASVVDTVTVPVEVRTVVSMMEVVIFVVYVTDTEEVTHVVGASAVTVIAAVAPKHEQALE